MARTWSTTSNVCQPLPLAWDVVAAPVAVHVEARRYAASVRPDAPPSCQSRSSAESTLQLPAAGRSKPRNARASAPTSERTVRVGVSPELVPCSIVALDVAVSTAWRGQTPSKLGAAEKVAVEDERSQNPRG